ncbi:hypothetical protein ACFSKU_10810 [Pontibacter silvestris]|uniref:STAS/SEC14 domain-containing protein n=1 Tax=Pontibacter silvestris TaxID=2305183 RepID=A0ABW4WXF1_9BACT|nr:hypothetical protein [Pontibacter silvestris]MCC9138995.1 hypothetical protein [Pontibacter silvestris]
MTGRTLASEPHITIRYDVIEDILYANWTGEQTGGSVMDGCERILHYLQLHRCSKVLNDNTNVTGMWSDASEWVAVEWFPGMHQAGCRLFAWVLSPNLYSKLSADLTLSYGINGVIATTFESKDTAKAWLKAMG